jgi:hypothetical protein
MTVDARSKRAAACLLSIVALVGLAAAGCSEIRPESDVEEGGLLESPTHEQDAVRRTEERQRQNRGGGGGGGGY